MRLLAAKVNLTSELTGVADGLTVPARAMQSPLRFPVHNVFKSSTGGPSGLGVSGRLESGIIQVGDKLAVLPGDEHATVKSALPDAFELH